jgi:hypothetical protein
VSCVSGSMVGGLYKYRYSLYYELLLDWTTNIHKFLFVCVEAKKHIPSTGQVGTNRYLHLPAPLLIIQKELCFWWLHFIHKYVSFVPIMAP